MKNKRIERMLQDCLEGYEGGLTPEECLSAYSEEREQLEPLLRRALSLRIAYAASPREEFRLQAREKLMFAAGRDVREAMAVGPDPSFVAESRERLLNAAGAAAQEALRDVPPPRLAFWINARRRLLEAAALPRPRTSRGYGLVLRFGLSTAVVAIAVGVATLVPFTGGSLDPADARLAVLEQRIAIMEQRTSEGQQVSGADLLDVTKKLNEFAHSPAAPDRVEKIEGLYTRSNTLKEAAGDAPTLAQAQEQLKETEERLRQFDNTRQATTQQAPTSAPAAVPTVEPSPTATQTPPPEVAFTFEPLDEGVVRKTLVLNDNYAGYDWERLSTNDVSFLLPASWRVLNLTEDEDGFLALAGGLFVIQVDGGESPTLLIINPTLGSAQAGFRDITVTLRDQGPDGDVVDSERLAGVAEVAGFDGSAALAFERVLRSIIVRVAP